MQEPNDNGHKPEENKEIVEPKIVIALKNGDVTLEGNCFNNLPLALFMLEMARDMVKANGITKAMEQKDRIVTANKAGFRNFLKFKR